VPWSDFVTELSSPELERRFRQFTRVIRDYGVTAAADVDLVRPHCRVADFAPGAWLQRAGQTADRVFFICDGLVRFYYLTGDGVEHNKSFAVANGFAGAPQAARDPVPGRFHIQALEFTRALDISLAGLSDLYCSSLAWANLGRRYMEEVAARKTRREGEFLLDSAGERYRRFLREEPELASRLPLYQVASYLGITDVALSRIRRRIKAEGDLNPG
jgi:CRP-like cAMP-binding protein